MSKTLWICGKAETPFTAAWEFQGVFESEALAVSACLNERYFIGPAVLNQTLPDDPIAWDGCYYPVTGAQA